VQVAAMKRMWCCLEHRGRPGCVYSEGGAATHLSDSILTACVVAEDAQQPGPSRPTHSGCKQLHTVTSLTGGDLCGDRLMEGVLLVLLQVIGFDMGGTSTDVSRYAGSYEHVFESTTAGVTIQAPQLDINTVAAGGGSRLFYRWGWWTDAHQTLYVGAGWWSTAWQGLRIGRSALTVRIITDLSCHLQASAGCNPACVLLQERSVCCWSRVVSRSPRARVLQEGRLPRHHRRQPAAGAHPA